MRMLLDLLFPPRCAACGELLELQALRDPSRALCTDCLKQWNEAKKVRCEVCSKPISSCLCMPLRMQKAKCECLGKLTLYDSTKRGSVPNDVIYAIKRQRILRTHRFLANEMLPLLCQMGVDTEARESTVLTYLPRTDRARLSNGTDQARELAVSLSALTGISMQPLLCRRMLWGREQKRLSAEARALNVKRSIRAIKNASCHGKTVVLLDDIVTTGAGMAECTRLLRCMGADRVLCLAVAMDDVRPDYNAHESSLSDGGKLFSTEPYR